MLSWHGFLCKNTSWHILDATECSDYVLTMATLLKDSKGRSPFWICAFTTAHGRRLKKSTKVRITPEKNDTKTGSQLRSEAMSICLKWEKFADSARNGTATEAQARRVVAEILHDATGEVLHFQSCKEWLESWLKSKDGSTATGTLDKYKGVIEEFIQFLGDKASKPLSAISPADVIGFQDTLRKRKLAAPTVNLAVKKTLNAPFAEAARLGYIAINPVAAAKSLKDELKSQRDAFTTTQLDALLSAAGRGDWHGAILCGLTTGLRLTDVTSLTWGGIDLRQRIITVDAKKTGEEMTIPMHRAFISWLKKAEPGIAKAPVFPTLNGKKPGGCNGLSAQFGKLLKLAGVHGRTIRTGEGGGHRTSSLSFHSLRHTFTSAMANAGVHPDIRRKLTGHSDAAIHARYSHHEIETMRTAVETLALPIRKTEPSP
jgi:integrase